MVLIFIIFLHQQLRLELEAFQKDDPKRLNFVGHIRDSLGQLSGVPSLPPVSDNGQKRPPMSSAEQQRWAGLAFKGAATR